MNNRVSPAVKKLEFFHSRAKYINIFNIYKHNKLHGLHILGPDVLEP